MKNHISSRSFLAVCFFSLTTQGLTPPLPSLPVVLKQAGKTVFRPGGSAATQQLLQWADTNDDTMMIRVISPYNKNDLQLPSPTTSTVLLEAILTHQPDATKDEILQSLASQQLLLHDVCIRSNTYDDSNPSKIQQDMTHALGTGFYALSVKEWQQLVQRNGYCVMECQQGPLPSMNPKRWIQEEGWRRTVRIVWNLVTHPQWRERVQLARTAMTQHHDNLGYIILRAVQANHTVVELN